MRTLILGDIHGNIIALEKVAKLYFKEVDHIICHGDVVNYGPWSNECVDLLDARDVVCLKGNHEDAYLLGYYPNSNLLVKHFFNQTYKNFDRFKQISHYTEYYNNEHLIVKHTIQNKYFYPNSDMSGVQITANTVIGHSHYPFINKLNNYYFVNTGSVGQNRKDLSIINFAIFDETNGVFEIIHLKYNPKPLITEMINSNYPEDCINYYKSKLK